MPAKKKGSSKSVASKVAKKPQAKKPAKKAAKKPVKKVAKKAVKKVAKKKVAKKKVAKKKVAKKKVAKKKVAKKKVAKKKVAKSAPKKKEGKKPAKVAKKVVKKAAPAKKAAPKAAKRVAPAKKAAPKAAKKVAPAKKAAKKVAPKAAKKAGGKSSGKRTSKPASKGTALMENLRGTTGLPANGLKLTGFVAKQRQRLLDLRDELINSMYGVTRETLRNAPEGSEASGSGMHQGDAGSDAYDRDFALSVLAKEQDALFEVEEALKRIQRGAYGKCEISGRKIPQARLEAIPFARLTVECQAEWEKENGHRRFKPSGDVGFGGDEAQVANDDAPVSLDGSKK